MQTLGHMDRHDEPWSPFSYANSPEIRRFIQNTHHAVANGVQLDVKAIQFKDVAVLCKLSFVWVWVISFPLTCVMQLAILHVYWHAVNKQEDTSGGMRLDEDEVGGNKFSVEIFSCMSSIMRLHKHKEPRTSPRHAAISLFCACAIKEADLTIAFRVNLHWRIYAETAFQLFYLTTCITRQPHRSA